MAAFDRSLKRDNYDVVIIGGAIMGSSTAWFLTEHPGFDGTVLVIEKDASYSACSTAHTNSCIRQQFSLPLNIEISRFGADFIKNIQRSMGDDLLVPNLSIQNFGYLYLAATQSQADVLRTNCVTQHGCGVPTQLMGASEIASAYPFYRVDDILLGSINRVDEGYFDGWAVFDAWRRQARTRGVDYIANEVVGLSLDKKGRTVERVLLKDGTSVGCGQLVNATGPRAALTAKMAGIDIPIEPRKRFSFVFKAATPLGQALPLTIDPSGVHVRENGGGTYLAGARSDHDNAVSPDDFSIDLDIWEDHVWPTLAHRIPAFEAIKVTAQWAGHYAYNTLDQNAVVGPHWKVTNFHFINGFSGHGLQQSPAMGRGLAEWLTTGRYETLDLTPFHFDRIRARQPLAERAVI